MRTDLSLARCATTYCETQNQLSVFELAAGAFNFVGAIEEDVLMDSHGTQAWWWCRRCHTYVDLVDHGDAYPQCDHCRSRQVEWREPQADARTVAGYERRVQTISFAAAPTAPLTRVKKHLPADKKDLRKLARTGFWFCYADDCRQITERNEMGECVCCGAALEEEHNWNPPVFKEEEKAA
jgi:hypothetical protein